MLVQEKLMQKTRRHTAILSTINSYCRHHFPSINYRTICCFHSWIHTDFEWGQCLSCLPCYLIVCCSAAKFSCKIHTRCKHIRPQQFVLGMNELTLKALGALLRPTSCIAVSRMQNSGLTEHHTCQLPIASLRPLTRADGHRTGYRA